MYNRRKNFLIKWANRNGYIINYDCLDDIVRGLETKKENFGVTYCPCIMPKKHNYDLVCPCKPTRDKIGEGNTCHCGLFSWEE